MEVGDAGNLPATSQVTVGAGSLDFISGTITNPSGDRFDQDMFLIRITGAVPFAATAVSSGTPTTFDTQLFLFDQFGNGVLANDDTSASESRSTIPSTVLPAGLYNLAVSKYNSDPLSPGGLIFPDTPRTGVFGPTGPGGGLPISAWTSGDPGDPPFFIEIPVGAAEFAVLLPEPSTLVLSGIGALALWICRTRRQPGRYRATA